MNDLIDIITNLTVYLSVFYPFLYLLGFAKNSKAYKVFTIYLLGIGVIQFLMVFVIKFLDFETNLFLFKYYFIFQFLLLSYFYKTLLGYRWIYFMTSIALLFFIFQYIDDPELSVKYNPLGSAIAQIIIVIYSLLYFYKLLSNKGEFLIVNIGFTFYLLISILFFGVGNFVFLDSLLNIASVMKDMNAVFFFIFQFLIMLEWKRNYYNKTVLNG